jgi:probable F420-dependent oxidoreductase
LEFCLIYPVKEGYCNPETVARVAVAAEEEGFHSLLVWDHYLMPAGPDTLDAWTLLSYVAGITSTIRLGTVVTPIPFRPPAQLAKIAATVDVLSGGRLILGVGAGWHQPEFDGFSRWESSGVRVDQTTEALDLMVRLWGGEPVDFTGKHYSATGAQIAPTSVQKPHPPMWFGTRGKRMMELAAQYADAWIPTNLEPDEYRRGMEKLRSRRKELGVSGDIKGALQHFTAFTDTQEFLATIKAYADAGCGYYGAVWSYPPDEMVSRIKWFGREVMPYAPA